jgi:flagellar biosynthesis anti-sigma factor FlgM
MIDIPSVGSNGHTSPARIAARRAAQQQEAAPQAGSLRGDSVEVSAAAQLLARLSDLPDVRSDLVDRVKAEITSGDYETPEKLDAAIDGLIEDAETF